MSCDTCGHAAIDHGPTRCYGGSDFDPLCDCRAYRPTPCLCGAYDHDNGDCIT